MADDKIERQITFITENIARMQEGMAVLKNALLSLATAIERRENNSGVVVERDKEAAALFRELRERLGRIGDQLN